MVRGWGSEGMRERVWLSKHERGRERDKKHIIVHVYMHERINMHACMPTSLNCFSFCSTPSAIALYWSACCRAAFSWVCRPDDKMPANWAPLASYTPLHPKQKLTVVWLRTKFALPTSTGSHSTIRPWCHRVLVKSQTCNQTLHTCSCAV